MNDPKQPIERLIEGTRIRGQSRMIPDGMRSDAVTKQLGESVIHAVLAYITQTQISRSDVAR